MQRSLRTRSEDNKSAGHSGAMLLRRALEIFVSDCEAWRLPPARAIIFAVLPIIATLVFLATAPFPSLFLWLIDEDSLLEWLQFLFLLPASLLFAWLGMRLMHAGRPAFGALYVLLALGAFFVAGEEISWGQRILGIHTPETLEAINAQQEISVHNIYGFHQLFIYAAMFGGMYGAIIPLLKLAVSADRRRSTLSYLLIPPLCLVPAFFMPFGYRLFRLIAPLERYYPQYAFIITEFSELTELCLYFGLLVFAWLNLRHLQQEPL